MCVNTLFVGQLPRLGCVVLPCKDEQHIDYLNKCFSPRQIKRVISERKRPFLHFSPRLCAKDMCEIGCLGREVLEHLSP